MVRKFKRFKTSRNLKYTGDGDAKTFSAISEVKPCGPGISKIEYEGHIQKRMGTCLQKLKINKLKCSDGKTFGRKGRLTDKIIDKLTSYYGNGHKAT